jgi:CubicO group peptidase (beta-lactamase class C family)
MQVPPSVAGACALLLASLLSSPAVAVELSPAGIAAAAEYSAARKGTALLIVQHGKVLYATPGATPRKIYSGTKGYWNLAALQAQEQGILDLDERVSDTITEWQADAAKARVTIRQLLDFTSGLEPAFRLHGDRVPDRNAVALRLPLAAAPGEAFIYGPASLQVFHVLLERKLGSRGTSPTRFLERQVLSPLRLGSQRYLADQRGHPLLATGFMQTPEQWARVGRVVLEGGRPVLRRSSFDEALRGSRANPAFSLGFWNNRASAQPGAREVSVEDMLDLPWQQQNWRNACLCRDAPPDLVASIGSGNQRLFAIPSLELIVVRQGINTAFSDAEFLRRLLKR